MTVRRGLIAVLTLMLLGLQARLWVGEGSLAQVSALDDRVELARSANEGKVERNRVLRAEIRDLKSGLESIEEKARREFGMIREDETFFLLVDKRTAKRRDSAGERDTGDRQGARDPSRNP